MIEHRYFFVYIFFFVNEFQIAVSILLYSAGISW